jgi:pSer/pThr/pTyr-binding forkhead associated (FHA) protein
VFFGRDMPQMGSTKVFDLTSFGGVRKGISRRHAEINLTHDNHLELVDLGSTNGTYLNYKKLKPLQSYPVHDGDQIRLGKISIEIFFEHG